MQERMRMRMRLELRLELSLVLTLVQVQVQTQVWVLRRDLRQGLYQRMQRPDMRLLLQGGQVLWRALVHVIGRVVVRRLSEVQFILRNRVLAVIHDDQRGRYRGIG